ncbi:hypothetical protein CFO_g4871 [Ceratocystis platani]|uniref:Uncharacterized protein n=1 Tax=Ceratocystis fimbriata f. sp. platani TaxID=88771 RepID=A0A0F8B092_CERFI|nr:hypothetical protein CFO_g4871 [Ceratocystis platani]
MKSIAMDIDEWFTHGSVQKHRQDNSLVDQDFDIAANQLGWEIFSKTSFYNDATKMLPGFEAEKITIKQQKRASPTPRYAAVVAEVMMVSFKQPGLKDEDTVVSPTDAHASELSARAI